MEVFDGKKKASSFLGGIWKSIKRMLFRENSLEIVPKRYPQREFIRPHYSAPLPVKTEIYLSSPDKPGNEATTAADFGEDLGKFYGLTTRELASAYVDPDSPAENPDTKSDWVDRLQERSPLHAMKKERGDALKTQFDIVMSD